MKAGRIYTSDDLASDAVLGCDVCVVGSGAGGAALAYELTRRGLAVVLLEEGGHHTRADFDMTEEKAYAELYQELGSRATSDLSIGILQGRCVGGGTTVNWCSTFRTPSRILQHWAEVHGVRGLSEEVLRPYWKEIETRLHVQPWPLEQVNRNNRILWDGLGKLGHHRDLIPRNVRRCADLGYCGMGCPLDAKQSTLVTYIPDAVEKGLTVLANTRAQALEVSGRKVARVWAEVLDRASQKPKGVRVQVSPKVVAVCCGAINSPALLLRSGLDGAGRVGRRTFLHPVVIMGAQFDEPVEAYYGAPQSVYSHQFIERGAGKLGFFLEVPPIHPLLAATTLTGFGREHENAMETLPNLHASIAVVVDGLLPQEEGGTVALGKGPGSRLQIDYPLTELHWEAFSAACMEMAKIQFAAGARRVFSFHSEPVVLHSASEVHKLQKAPWEKLRVRVVTAHQMGGCCMGANAHSSVVDSTLRYHGLSNLFVVDGSVLPTGLGVNPQLTILGLAMWGGQHVAAAA